MSASLPSIPFEEEEDSPVVRVTSTGIYSPSTRKDFTFAIVIGLVSALGTRMMGMAYDFLMEEAPFPADEALEELPSTEGGLSTLSLNSLRANVKSCEK